MKHRPSINGFPRDPLTPPPIAPEMPTPRGPVKKWIAITSFLGVPAACWVFDLDGTLSDHRERLARLMPEDPERSGAWEPYNAAHAQDPVFRPIAALFRQVVATPAHSAVILTRRPEHYRASTEAWLGDASIGFSPKDTPLIMAPSSLSGPPERWKARILSRLSRAASPGLCIVLDDDPRVLSVARDQGLLAVNAGLAWQMHV